MVRGRAAAAHLPCPAQHHTRRRFCLPGENISEFSSFSLVLTDLTESLERKSEEEEALRANYDVMRQQMELLRAAAHAKLGLPPPEPEHPPPEEAGNSRDPLNGAADENAAPQQADAVPAGDAPSAQCDAAMPSSVSAEKPPSLPKPLADVLREPLERGKVTLKKLDEAAAKKIDEAREALERSRDGFARGLSDALSRLQPELEQQKTRGSAR